MSSTTPVREFYRGPVRNFALFIDFSSILCFGATMFAAYRLTVLCQRKNRPSSFREPSLRLKAFVASLCLLQFLHAVLANISHYTLPADLTLDAKATAPWAMKLTFLTTAITLALSLAYIMRIVGQVAPPERWASNLLVVSIVFPFVITVVASLRGQEIMHGTIERYFELFNGCGLLWVLFVSLVQTKPTKVLNERSASDIRRIFKTLHYVLGSFRLAPFIILIPIYFYNTPHIFWVYAQLATYEGFGNAYPSILIALMCMPGFGAWERDNVP